MLRILYPRHDSQYVRGKGVNKFCSLGALTFIDYCQMLGSSYSALLKTVRIDGTKGEKSVELWQIDLLIGFRIANGMKLQ